MTGAVWAHLALISLHYSASGRSRPSLNYRAPRHQSSESKNNYNGICIDTWRYKMRPLL